jgi:hypothetical protein
VHCGSSFEGLTKLGSPLSAARKLGNGVNTSKYHIERRIGDDFRDGLCYLRDAGGLRWARF